jgi:hypothetical protein
VGFRDAWKLTTIRLGPTMPRLRSKRGRLL